MFMARHFSKSSLQCLLVFILAFVLISFFLNTKSLDWYSNHQWEMLVRPRCNQSVNPRYCVVVLVTQDGRLGNRMFMFASAIGIALTYSCQLAINEDILEELRAVFTIDLTKISKIQLLDPSNIHLCANQIYNYCDYFPIRFENYAYGVMELTGFWQSCRYFYKYTKLIKNQFNFKDSITDKMTYFFRTEEQKYIHRLRTLYQHRQNDTYFKHNSTTLPFTWIGVHIRRGDFLYVRQISSKQFIDEAMYYFEKKYSNVIYLIASDDKVFCEDTYRNYSNVIITPVSFSPGEDLAALSMCQHMIVTVGTFGWWAGFLGNGEVLHDIRFSENPTPVDNNCTLENYLSPSFSFFNKTFL